LDLDSCPRPQADNMSCGSCVTATLVEHSGYSPRKMKVKTEIDTYLGEILLSKTPARDRYYSTRLIVMATRLLRECYGLKESPQSSCIQ